MRYVAPSASPFQYDSEATDTVKITVGYWMGETEVTQELFAAVMGTNPSYLSSSPAGVEDQEKRPVEMVSWYEAIAFCNKLSLLDSKTPAYNVAGINWETLNYGDIPSPDWGEHDATWDAAAPVADATGYRLPTEMEWMWAQMGGTAAGGAVYTTGYLKAYAGEGMPGVNGPGDVAWYVDNSNSDSSGNKTHQVGQKLANELGLYDMSGNVVEWCWDWYGSLSGTLADNYPGKAVPGSARVRRGGCWGFDASYLRSAYRDNYGPSDRGSDLGFRLVRP
jgi:formylglycine-generating enzyme required for sulfatase activity